MCAALFCTSCDWFGWGEEKETYTVLFYLAADNSLSSYAEENLFGRENSDIQGIVDGYMPSADDEENILLVYYDLGDEYGPKLSRFYRGHDDKVYEQTLVKYPVNQNSATMETLEAVIADAETVYPSTRHGLILWSHGTGFLPEGYGDSNEGKRKSLLTSFAEERSREIELQDLRKVLSPIHYDYIIFDCCLMGGVEVAYELKDCADYIAFSQTEIMAVGLQYGTMMNRLFNIPYTENAVIAVSQDYMDYYFSLPENDQCATWSVVKCSELPALAEVCSIIFEDNRDKIATLDRSDIQNYYRFSTKWFFDLDDFIGRIAEDEQYGRFTAALNRALVYRNATSRFLSIDIRHYCGLSTYIPYSGYPQLNTYYSKLLWNEAVGLVK